MSARNAPGRALATLVALAPGVAQAQPAGEQAMEAYRQVEAWVRDWTPPEDAADGLATPVGIILRFDGEIIGRGLDLTGTPGALARAAAQALAEADLRLPVDPDAALLAPDGAVAGRVTISLELGAEPEALPVQTLQEVALRLSPGLEGVAVRAGDQWSGMLPGMMLATRTDAAAAAAIAFREVAGERARQLAGPAVDPASAAPQMLERRDVTVYRVPTTHLAQPGPGEAPIFLYRGGRIVPLEALDTAALRRWSASMASFLLTRRYPGAERFGMMGALNPTEGLALQITATPAQQAICALAMRRYSQLDRVDPTLATTCDVFATGMLRDLDVVEAGEAPPWEATHDAAAVVVALLEISPDGAFEDVRLADLMQRTSERVRSAYTPLRGYAEDVLPGAEAMIAWAMVRLARAGQVDSGTARAAVRAIYRDTPEGELATHMPWLWYAEDELAGLGGEAEGELGAAGALRAVRDILAEHQLESVDLDETTRDFAGGIVFTGAGPALPTWNTARPLCAMSAMLGDERITSDEEFLAEFNRVRAGLRFLRQLTADEATGHMYRFPARAAGGVRAAPWDQTMPPDATSLSLLCVVETLESMEAWLGRQERQ
ncbi:MAG: hypothetical protein ACF8R7_09945 [Phycisphaerales bacterium JB039]